MNNMRDFAKFKFHFLEAAEAMESMKEDVEGFPDKMSLEDSEALTNVTRQFNSILLGLIEFIPHWEKVFKVLEPLYEDFKQKNGID